jgi:hypothetical protein
LSAGNILTIVGFRCIEAMYDCSPPVVESSLTNYVLYYTTACPFDWNKQTQTVRKVTKKEVMSMLIRFYFHFTVLGLVLSFLMHFNFQPFESNVTFNEWNLTWDLVSPAHLANAYLVAVLTYFNLWVGFEGSALAQNAQGYATKPIFSNPLLTSTNPIDFWTKKWNTMIHLILKVRTKCMGVLSGYNHVVLFVFPKGAHASHVVLSGWHLSSLANLLSHQDCSFVDLSRLGSVS